MHTTLTARSLATAGAALATAALLLTGCSSASGSPSATSVGSASSGAPSATGAATGGTATGPASSGTPGSSDNSASGSGSVVVVHTKDKGHTVTLHPGQTLEVILEGGYWPTPASSAATVLHQSGAPTFLSASPGRGCPPGVGCRPQRTDFSAVAPGTATVSSTRTNCGEAMRCTDANGSFTITVDVVA